MKRKLASIQAILSLDPIENADRIERASILGWNTVVKKGEFKVGDCCVWFEIDAVLPDGQEWAEFMRPRNFRIKTCRLRGVLSQGLALPISILPAGFQYKVGNEVTELLGIRKFEPTSSGFGSGQSLGTFPSFIPKTDEIRLQSILLVLEELKDINIYWTVKCDGTSSTFYRMDDEFFACSRNWKKRDGDNVYWNIAKKYKLNELIPNGYAVQGELCGPGIQKNRLRLKEIELFVFDVFDIKRGEYLNYNDMIEFCDRLGLKVVPLLGMTDDPVFDHSLEAWLERAGGVYEGTDNRREGIVVRSVKPIYSKAVGDRLSFKVLNNEFLLKDED